MGEERVSLECGGCRERNGKEERRERGVRMDMESMTTTISIVDSIIGSKFHLVTGGPCSTGSWGWEQLPSAVVCKGALRPAQGDGLEKFPSDVITCVEDVGKHRGSMLIIPISFLDYQ